MDMSNKHNSGTPHRDIEKRQQHVLDLIIEKQNRFCDPACANFIRIETNFDLVSPTHFKRKGTPPLPVDFAPFS